MMAKGIHECCAERPVTERPLLLQDNREEVTSLKINKPFLTQRVKRSGAPSGSKTGKKKHPRRINGHGSPGSAGRTDTRTPAAAPGLVARENPRGTAPAEPPAAPPQPRPASAPASPQARGSADNGRAARPARRSPAQRPHPPAAPLRAGQRRRGQGPQPLRGHEGTEGRTYAGAAAPAGSARLRARLAAQRTRRRGWSPARPAPNGRAPHPARRPAPHLRPPPRIVPCALAPRTCPRTRPRSPVTGCSHHPSRDARPRSCPSHPPPGPGCAAIAPQPSMLESFDSAAGKGGRHRLSSAQ